MEYRRVRMVGYVVVLACALAVQLSSLSSPLDHRLLDAQFRFLRAYHPRPVAPDVVIIGIDEATITAFREPLGLWHPHLAQFFAALMRAQPAVVGLDVVLPERSFDFLLPGHDRLLLSAMLELNKAVPVVLAQTLDEKGKVRPLFAPVVALVGPDALGLVVVKLDADGVQRRFESAVGTGPDAAPTLVARISQRLGLQAKAGLIDYSRGEPFKFVSLSQVIGLLEAGDEDSLVGLMRGKPVLLGSVLPFEDRHVVPVALAAWEPRNLRVPGVLVHAQALRSLISGGPITPIPSPVSWLLCLGMTLLWWAGRRAVLGAAAWLLVAAALTAGSTALLYYGTYLPIAGLIIIGAGSLLARIGVESWFAFQDRRRLRKSFGPYVSPSVLKEILSGRLRPEMGGVRQTVCVLFSDIRGFTSRSEKEQPEQIVALLNRYFEEMAQAVHAHNGTLDKFIGDGLMAFFGMPGKSSSPARDALAAGQEMLRRLKDLNLRLAADGIPEVEIGIGLHIGEAVVGHVGSSQRHEYTAIGDVVNLAARLEGLTKDAGFPLVCSQEVMDASDGAVSFVPLGEKPIKGRSAVPVFGWKP